MKFNLSHTFEAEINIVEQLMFEKDFLDYLLKHHKLVESIEILEFKEDSETIKRQIQYLPKPIIEKVGPYKIPAKVLAWREESIYYKNKKEMRFENMPLSSKVQRLLVNKGVMKLSSLGNNLTKREVSGELKVKVFMLGKIAEQIIYHQAQRLLNEEARVFANFIKEKTAK